ncbi:MAG: hypothetical protein U0Q19_06300 [Kineosporiaceae bacterium]
MACGHRGNCPIFPLLNASLAGWRDAYCDSDTGWAGCARYRLSAMGEPVPLALLPNGHMPLAMARSVDREQRVEQQRAEQALVHEALADQLNGQMPQSATTVGAHPVDGPWPSYGSPGRAPGSWWTRLWARVRAWMREPA